MARYERIEGILLRLMENLDVDHKDHGFGISTCKPIKTLEESLVEDGDTEETKIHWLKIQRKKI